MNMLTMRVGYSYDGLADYRARYYDPQIGRFVSEDPIGFRSGNNFYSYVENDPVDSGDPSGLKSYRCSKPLHFLEEKLGKTGAQVAYSLWPLGLRHEFLCIEIDGKVTCGGQDRSGGSYSPGKPSRDDFIGGVCNQLPDDSCMDQCMLKKVNSSQRPDYGLIGPGTNCQEYVSDVMIECKQECRKKTR